LASWPCAAGLESPFFSAPALIPASPLYIYIYIYIYIHIYIYNHILLHILIPLYIHIQLQSAHIRSKFV
jgi:hypothetical protein